MENTRPVWEIARVIPGVPGYMITKDAEIYDFYEEKWMIMPKPSANRYVKVRLRISTQTDKKKVFLLHRLVALAWIPNPMNKPHVDHWDMDKTNNSADNLSWVTPSENMKNAKLPKGKSNEWS